MNDIYLVRRESNRGCWVLGIAALLILFIAWFVFFHDHTGSENPEYTGGTNPEQIDNNFDSGFNGGDNGFTSANPPERQARPISPGMEVRPVGSPARPQGNQGNQNNPVVNQGNPAATERSGRPPSGLSGRVNPNSKTALARAQNSMEGGDFSTARKYGFIALGQASSAGGVRNAENFLSDLHTRLAFSRASMEEKVDYKIKYGDALSKIAKKYGTTTSMLKRTNGLSSDRINLGDTLKIIDGTWSVHVDVARRELRVLLNDRFFKRYDVGVGKPGSETPVGTYLIKSKQTNPDWYKSEGVKIPFGDPRNELGTRWLGWDKKSFGIHGTNNPASIGKNASSGCVRMNNSDVEELFDILPYNAEISKNPSPNSSRRSTNSASSRATPRSMSRPKSPASKPKCPRPGAKSTRT